MRHTQEKEIDGINYQFVHLPATTAFKIQQRLIGIVGRPLASAVSQFDPKKGIESTIDMESIVGVLVENLADERNESLMKDLIKGISFDGKEISAIFDVHFAGRMGHLWKVLFEQIQFQYSDVFQGLVERIGQAAASINSPVLNTLFGQPGDASSVKLRPSRK
jgi:hypothetical protein